jgi:hypothetical protein
MRRYQDFVFLTVSSIMVSRATQDRVFERIWGRNQSKNMALAENAISKMFLGKIEDPK